VAGIILAVHHRDLAVLIGLESGAGDQVGPPKAHLPARGQPPEFLVGLGHEVIALHIDLLAKGHLAVAHLGRVIRVVGRVELLLGKSSG
jgi:hypothetical protein